MNRPFLVYLVVIGSVCVTCFFWLMSAITVKVETEMSMLSAAHKQTLRQWGRTAETYHLANDLAAIQDFLTQLMANEEIEARVVSYNTRVIAGKALDHPNDEQFQLGRSVDWKIHLYFPNNPTMELPFVSDSASLLVTLPQRMRPGSQWQWVKLVLQIVLPIVFLTGIAWLIYRQIMRPLNQLQRATVAFSQGKFDAKVIDHMCTPHREFKQLALTFDSMAARISQQFNAQRQLIADFSHELRTPLTRLDIAIEQLSSRPSHEQLRLSKESGCLRQLVEDTLSYAWLENENRIQGVESFDAVDLLSAIVEDAQFEYPNHLIHCTFPDSVWLTDSNHRALGPAVENILRNALKYSPEKTAVTLSVSPIQTADSEQPGWKIDIADQGPGVPDEELNKIFLPFYRTATPAKPTKDSFGLGLALAKRQLASIGAHVHAENGNISGLVVSISLSSH